MVVDTDDGGRNVRPGGALTLGADEVVSPDTVEIVSEDSDVEVDINSMEDFRTKCESAETLTQSSDLQLLIGLLAESTSPTSTTLQTAVHNTAKACSRKAVRAAKREVEALERRQNKRFESHLSMMEVMQKQINTMLVDSRSNASSVENRLLNVLVVGEVRASATIPRHGDAIINNFLYFSKLGQHQNIPLLQYTSVLLSFVSARLSGTFWSKVWVQHLQYQHFGARASTCHGRS